MTAHFYGFETTSEFFKIKKLDTHLVKMKDGVMLKRAFARRRRQRDLYTPQARRTRL